MSVRWKEGELAKLARLTYVTLLSGISLLPLAGFRVVTDAAAINFVPMPAAVWKQANRFLTLGDLSVNLLF